MVAVGARGGLWGAIVPTLLVGLSFAVVPAHASPETFTTSDIRVSVSGPSEVVKDLVIGLRVEDDRGVVIGQCVWDGRFDSPGHEASTHNQVDRVVRDFNVVLSVKYKGHDVIVKSVHVHVDDPGRPIVVEMDGIEYFVSGGTNLPEISKTCSIDGETVRIRFKPVVKVTKLISALLKRVTEFQYIIDNGIIEIRGRAGSCRIVFTGHVEVSPLRPEATALGLLTLLAGLRPLASVLPKFSFSCNNVVLTAKVDTPAKDEARVLATVSAGNREVRLDSRWKEGPDAEQFLIPTGPVRLRVELYWRGRRVGAFEYLVRPGRVVVPLLGPRYVEVRIERVRAEAVEGLRALEPVIEHPSDSDPVTLIHWCYLYYPEGGSGPITYEVTLRISPDLPVPPGSFPSSEDVANILLGFSTACLVRALNDALGLPRSLVDGFLITPPRLPPEYALLGLAACLATLASRYYLGLLTYALTGAYVQEGVFGALPLGLWGLRLIAAGTGLPLPLAGALTRFVQWVLDEAYWLDECPWWDTLRRVLLNPVKYVGRCLRELIEEGPIGAACDLAWLAIQGTLITVPPPPLAYVLYLASDNGEGPDPITSAITYFLDAAITCLEYPALAPVYALELGAPLLVSTLNVPQWLQEALALPSLLSYLLELLVILPQHLLSAPATEVRAAVTVLPPTPGRTPELQRSFPRPEVPARTVGTLR